MNQFVFSDSEELTSTSDTIQPVISGLPSDASPSSRTCPFYLTASVNLTHILSPGVDIDSVEKD